MPEDKITITLSVLGETYTLQVPREDEIYYRDAQKSVVNSIETYRRNLRGTKDADNTKKILAMTSLSLAYSYRKAKSDNGKEGLLKAIEDMTSDLRKFNADVDGKK